MIFRVTACKEVRLVKMSYVCTLELVETEYRNLHVQHAEPWVVSFPEPLIVGEEIDLSYVGRFGSKQKPDEQHPARGTEETDKEQVT